MVSISPENPSHSPLGKDSVSLRPVRCLRAKSPRDRNLSHTTALSEEQPPNLYRDNHPTRCFFIYYF